MPDPITPPSFPADWPDFVREVAMAAWRTREATRLERESRAAARLADLADAVERRLGPLDRWADLRPSAPVRAEGHIVRLTLPHCCPIELAFLDVTDREDRHVAWQSYPIPCAGGPHLYRLGSDRRSTGYDDLAAAVLAAWECWQGEEEDLAREAEEAAARNAAANAGADIDF